MLVVHARFQNGFFAGIKRQQILVAVAAAMQHPPFPVDSRVNHGGRNAAILGLYMDRVRAESDIAVVAEDQIQYPDAANRAPGIGATVLNLGDRGAIAHSRARFDRTAAPRYYTALPMSGSGLQTYAPLVLHLLVAAILAGLISSLSVLIGWRRPNRAKQQAYECGMEPTGDAREPFSVKFYLVAMVFILFDVEAIFLYPWAMVFRSLSWYGFTEMMIYIAILLVGYFYLWKKGALDWHK